MLFLLPKKRRYEIRASVSKNGVEKELIFESPARQAITQDIPLYNNTDEGWTLRASFTGSPFFTGPTQLQIAPHAHCSYALTFQPLEICEAASGTLCLAVMADTAGQWHALIGCYDRHRKPVARSN